MICFESDVILLHLRYIVCVTLHQPSWVAAQLPSQSSQTNFGRFETTVRFIVTMILEVVIIIITIILVDHMIKRLRERTDIPPGPPPLPIIGNFYNVAAYFPQMQRAFKGLAKKYGPLFTIYLNGQRVIVVNSVTAAREALLTKKDAFAGRPYSFSAFIFSRGYKGIGFTDYTPTLVLQRKLAHSAIRLAGPNLESKVTQEADELIKRIKQYNSQPFSPRTDYSLAIMNIICNVIFNKRYEVDDPEFLDLNENNHRATWVVGGLLDVFPWLYNFPVKDTKALNEIIRSRDNMLNRRYKEHIETYQDGKIRDLTDAMIKAKADEDSGSSQVITEDHIIMTMQDVFIAGHETSTTTLLWLTIFMTRHPKLQQKVHEELDQVVGRNRSPDLTDRDNLHYLQATIAETLRHSSLVPLMLPHKAIRDTELNGYVIPKDSMVLINSDAMNNDKQYWKQPEVFDPSRFLDDKGHYSSENAAYLPFGAGRRVCIGESIAKRKIFLFVAKILHQFEFKKAPGCSLENLDGEGRIVNTPKLFKVIAKDRLVK